jgi:hypothetical protein
MSSLEEIQRLLAEDLQYMCHYWIGEIYYNCGDYEACYKKWKLFLQSCERSFVSKKKLDKINFFLKNYSNICEK